MDWIETKHDTPVINTNVIIAFKSKGGGFNYEIAFMDGDEEWFCAGDESELEFTPYCWAYIQTPNPVT